MPNIGAKYKHCPSPTMEEFEWRGSLTAKEKVYSGRKDGQHHHFVLHMPIVGNK